MASFRGFIHNLETLTESKREALAHFVQGLGTPLDDPFDAAVFRTLVKKKGYPQGFTPYEESILDSALEKSSGVQTKEQVQGGAQGLTGVWVLPWPDEQENKQENKPLVDKAVRILVEDGKVSSANLLAALDYHWLTPDTVYLGQQHIPVSHSDTMVSIDAEALGERGRTREDPVPLTATDWSRFVWKKVPMTPQRKDSGNYASLHWDPAIAVQGKKEN